MTAFLLACLVLSLIGMFTTKQVADFCGPTGKGGPGDVLRTLFSVMWFTIGKLICLIFVLVFALGLAIIH